jgi:excisionase family DNA binding protein
MSPTAPRRPSGDPPSVGDLPYGPLPARPRSDEPTGSEQGAPELDQVLRFRRPEHTTSRKDPGEPAELEVAGPRPEADDDVHFGVAAKALGVSRRTVERMVKRGQLSHGPSGAPATVSKRDLVAALEQRRRDVSHLTRATEVERAQSSYATLREAWPDDAVGELQELLRPVLEPLLADFIDARTRAAVLESQMQGIAKRAERDQGRDELLLVLATGSWRQRRKARRAALQRYVLRHGLDGLTPQKDG